MALNPPNTKYRVNRTAKLDAAAGAAAAVTLTSEGSDRVMVVDQIVWSFDRALTVASSLTIASPSATELFKIDIPIAAAGTPPGPNSIVFDQGFEGAVGEDVVITLAGTADAEIGKLNVLYH